MRAGVRAGWPEPTGRRCERTCHGSFCGYVHRFTATPETLLVTVDRSDDLLALTADIVVAHLAHNEVSVNDLPTLISGVHRALGSLGESDQPAAEPLKPAVPIRSSVKPDHLVCLEDGRKLKMLKRYLKDRFGMTPAEYREKWGLPADYPMVAPDYSTARKAIAERSGLGRKPASEVTPVEAAPAPEPAPAPTESVTPAATAPAEPPKRKVLKPLFARRDDSVTDRPDSPVRSEPASQPVAILCAAIARRFCVAASYNKRNVLLAPHVVFTRHGEPYLRAVTVEQDGRSPREMKLGTFKLAGLGAISLSPRPIVRFPGYPADEADYAENLVCALPSS